VQPKPAAFDRELETCAVFRRRAAQFVQERPVDQFDMDAAVLLGLMLLAISTSLRAAMSGSVSTEAPARRQTVTGSCGATGAALGQ
jgi:hypothetical protein